MTDVSSIGLITAFAGGLISFLSLCVLPLVPAYVPSIGGESLQTAGERVSSSRHSAAAMSVFFGMGFSAVFVALGARASALGQLILRFRHEANIIGGVLVIGFGVVMLGLARGHAVVQSRSAIPSASRRQPSGGRVRLGVAFGFGWTPCIGPVLGAILTLSAVQTSLSAGVSLLGAYTLGLALQFILSAFFVDRMIGRLKWLPPAGRWMQTVAAMVMIVMGIAMITGQLPAFAFWLIEVFPVLGKIG